MSEIGTERAPPNIGHVEYLRASFHAQNQKRGADLDIDTAVKIEVTDRVLK